MASTVTVVICTLNRAEILTQTLEDLWQLPTQPDEVLVVDQTDELPTAMRAYYDRHRDRLLVIRMDTKGLGQARNRAIKEATGDIILFIDDDVRLQADLVAEHRKHFDDPTVGAVVGRVDDATGDPPSCGGRVNWYGRVRVDRDVSRVHPVESLSGGNMSIRLDVARSLGGFWELRENLVQLREETDMALRIQRDGYQVICEPAASLLHLAYKSGGTRSSIDRIRWYEDYFFAEFRYFFRNFPKWKLPFYIVGMGRPILACGVYYGRLRPRALAAPWKALRRAWQ